MTNRISNYLTDDPHPLDRPEFADRQRGLRMMCLVLILGTVMVVTLITLVVRFALGGRPIVQNGALVGGIPIVTVIGAMLTLGAVAVATLLVPWLRAAGIRKIATTLPPPPEPGTAPENDADRLWNLYAQGKFTEYGLGDGAAIFTAVLYHLSADWLMIVFVAGMLAFLVLRFPTAARVRAWFDQALADLDREKQNAGGDAGP